MHLMEDFPNGNITTNVTDVAVSPTGRGGPQGEAGFA